MSQSIMNTHAKNVIRYCEGFRIHKTEVLALGQKCLELSEEYQRTLESHGSFHETRVEDVLSKAVNCTEQWSKNCICRQWISRRKMAQDIALTFNKICDTLQVLRTSNAIPPPATPVQKSIPLPSLSQHSLSISVSTTFARSSPHPSRSSTLSSTASEHPPPHHIPSPLSLSALSFPSLPDFNSSYPSLLVSAKSISAARPSQPLSPIPSSAVYETCPTQYHVTTSHYSDAPIQYLEQRGEGEDTSEWASGGSGSRLLVANCFPDSNHQSLLSSARFLRVHTAAAREQPAAQLTDSSSGSESIKEPRPKLKIKIPARRLS